jgi:hypothetical protein
MAISWSPRHLHERWCSRLEPEIEISHRRTRGSRDQQATIQNGRLQTAD